MDQEIADRQLARHERIPHLEGRQVPDDRRVPLDLPFFDEQAERGGGEQLGVRRDPEQRLRIDGRTFAEPADAVALRDHDLAVPDDGERESGNVEGAQHALDVYASRSDGGAATGVCARNGAPSQSTSNGARMMRRR